MIINASSWFIIPVRYVPLDELDLSYDCKTSLDYNLDNIKKFIEYFFVKMNDLIDFTTPENYFHVFKLLSKKIILANIRSLPAFENAKNNLESGINLDGLLDDYLEKFKSTFDLHMTRLNCNNFIEKRWSCFKENQLDLKLEFLTLNIQDTFNALIPNAFKLDINELLDMYLLMFEYLFYLLVDNTHCFNKFKSGVNGLSLENLIRLHKNKLRTELNKLFYLLDCK